MKNNKEVIELDADLYDTLELSAYEFGGIGAGFDFDYANTNDRDCPYCIAGHASFINNDNVGELIPLPGGELVYSRGANDIAVTNINRRKGKTHSAQLERVSWKEYVKERNIVRKAA